MRRDLIGLTRSEYAAWSTAAVGHDLRFHRAAYRRLMATGRHDPGTVSAWQEAEISAPGTITMLADQAEREQALTVEREVRVVDPEQGLTIKLRLRTADGQVVETVLIPMGQGRHYTVCVSSQVGCRMGCTFCHTATMGLIRQLGAHEIIGQVIAAQRHAGITVRNVVFMGMGEPFDNLDAVAQSVRILRDPSTFAIAARHLTISTVGRIDGLAQWHQRGLTGVNLAVSLTAADDALRTQLMPINRAMPTAALKHALLELRLVPPQRILIAVVVIPGRTNTAEAIERVVEWVRDLPVLVNLIPYNPIPSQPWAAPSTAQVLAVARALRSAGVETRLRTTKGDTVMAACGQLGD